MSKLSSIECLINNNEALEELLAIRIEEENNRLDGIPGIAPIDFIFFDNIKTNKDVARAYEVMQKQYVLREQDRIAYDDVITKLHDVKSMLIKNVSWNKSI